MRVGFVGRCANGLAGCVVAALGACAAGPGCAREPSSPAPGKGANASAASVEVARVEARAAGLEAEAGRLVAELGRMAESNRLQRHILYHNLACVYREARQPVDAEKAYLEAASLYPDAPDTQLGLGLLYEADLKQPDKARACFERFLALAPESPAAGEVRSRIGRLDGQANAAEAAK